MNPVGAWGSVLIDLAKSLWSPLRERRGSILPRSPITAVVRTVFSHSSARYVIVGGLSLLLDLAILTLFYRVLGAPLGLATGIGFWGSVVFNFTLQKRFAFQRSGATGRSLWRYGTLLVINTVLNIIVVAIFQRVGWGFVYGKVVVTAAQTVWNYFAYRYWVFAGRAVDVARPL